jgi:hypothetical protein
MSEADGITAQTCAKKKRGRPRSPTSIRSIWRMRYRGDESLRTYQRRSTAFKWLTQNDPGIFHRLADLIMNGDGGIGVRISATFIERLTYMQPEQRAMVIGFIEEGMTPRDAEGRLAVCIVAAARI